MDKDEKQTVENAKKDSKEVTDTVENGSTVKDS
jgi:hypothetical protein